MTKYSYNAALEAAAAMGAIMPPYQAAALVSEL